MEQYSLLTNNQNGQKENRLLQIFSVSEGLVPKNEEKMVRLIIRKKKNQKEQM